LHSKLHQEADLRTLNRTNHRLAHMARSLATLANMTELSVDTFDLISSFQRVVAQLQATAKAGNLTLYRKSLRTVTSSMLLLLRNMSQSQDLTNSVARAALRALVSESRALRGVTPFRDLPSISHHGRSGFVPRRPLHLGNSTRGFLRPHGNFTRGPFRPRGGNSTGTGRFVTRRPNFGVNGPLRGRANGGVMYRANGAGTVAGTATNGVASSATADETSFATADETSFATADENSFATADETAFATSDTATSSAPASPNSATPSWAIGLVVAASILTIALVIVAGLLAVRMPRDQI